MRYLAWIIAACALMAARPGPAQEAEADGALAVLLDLEPAEEPLLLAELDAAWPATRRIALGPDPATEGDPWFWSAVFQTPGASDVPPHGLTLTCTRHGPDSHRALIARRAPGLRPWPGGAQVRLFCEGQGVFWGRDVEALFVRGAAPMLETWAEERGGGVARPGSYRGADTAPRAGRMVRSFRLETSRAGGARPGAVVELEVEIFGFSRP